MPVCKEQLPLPLVVTRDASGVVLEIGRRLHYNRIVFHARKDDNYVRHVRMGYLAPVLPSDWIEVVW